ncbi:sirohydrochlorin chelatase [uncultured Streptomyces sp.]|uniref:sirohydrochlorin chelatase n=1 Tax=uncultured Streptomyces sp. TaxID=174707 RepID=UPI0026136058|nr:sirohydrochlorin chelatase [uncultured Streptomyces sp.]
MTDQAQNPSREPSPRDGGHHACPDSPDSATHLGSRPTDQAARLSLVAPNGSRTGPRTGTRTGPRTGTRTGPRTAPRTAPPALVAVAHGSRDPRALRTTQELLSLVRELRPGLDVRLGHIELNAPLLPDTLAGLGRGDAVLVPLLLGRGHHVKHDLPLAAAGAPLLRTRIAAPLGPHPLLVEALYGRLVEAGWPADGPAPGGAAVVLAAAGSRDPESAVDTRRTARMLSERLRGVPVVPAYASAATPTVPVAVRALAARGHHRVAVASYFAAPGRFATAAADAAPGIAAAPLGAHPAMARLLLHRYDSALAAAPPVPDTLATGAALAALA